MVKGVNRTVIEVNNTGSKLFERIVFYVTPEYGTLSAKQLRKAAAAFSFNFESGRMSQSLGRRMKTKRIIKLSIAAFLVCAAAVTALLLIL